MKKSFTPDELKRNNFGNNFITIESIPSADFVSQTNEQFAKCLDAVPVINKILIDKSKCDNDHHYKEVLLLTNTTLSLAMIERRIGIVKNP